ALPATLWALYRAWGQWMGFFEFDPRASSSAQLDLFSGLLVFDNFAIFLKMFLFGFTALIIALSMFTGIPDREDSGDFFCLLLGATIGMSIMASANHLLMIFIGI